VPKKILVAAAEAVHAARALGSRGVRADGVSIDWPVLMGVKRATTDPVPPSTEEGYAKAGIAAFHGRARFVGPTSLAVGGDRLIGRRILIAAGSIPQPLTFSGAEHVATSDQFLDLDTLPERIVFIGGGFISFEFAHVAARAGARVTILHRGARPLEAFDPDLVDQLVKRTRELGIRVELGTEVRALERTADGVVVRADVGGADRRFAADLAVLPTAPMRDVR
jgi:glutathione reductase (NADPH)